MAGHSTGLFCCFLTHFTALDGDDEKEKLFIDRDQVCVCGKKQTVDIVHISFMIWLFACHQIYQVLLLDALFWSKFSLYLVVEKN